MADTNQLPPTAPAESSPWRWLAPALVFSLAVGVYANTLFNGFTLDDYPLILNNTRIGDLGYIKYMLFDRELWRPLKRMTLMLDFAIWGSGRPAGFHATNVLFHAGACLAAYFVALRLSASRRLAAAAGLVFAVHPVHVEAVANIAHRKEPMSLLFYLLAFLVYLRGRGENPAPGPVASVLRRVGRAPDPAFVRGELVLLGALFYLAGMMSKEVGAVMLPFVVTFHELFVAREPWKVRREALVRFLPAFGAVLVLFWFRGYLGTLPRRFGTEQIEWVSSSKTTSYGTMLLIAAKAFVFDVGVMVWPWPLYFDRAFSIPTSLFDPAVLGGLALAGLAVAATFALARRAPLASLALAWFWINLAPVSNVVPLTYWFVAERFVYVPSFGFALLVGLAADKLWSLRESSGGGAVRSSPATPVLVGLLLIYGGVTIAQNRVWKSPETLWSHTLAHNPDSFRALYGYGFQLAAKGDDAGAEGYYRKALAVSPPYEDLQYALSVSLLRQGRWDDAIAEARTAGEMDRANPEPWIVIGNAEMGRGRYADAAEAYRRATERSPSHAEALFNLANALYGSGDNPGAVRAFDEAMRLRAPTANQWLLRGRILRRVDRAEDALAAFRKAAELDPGNPAVPDAMGRLLLTLGRREEAKQQLDRSLRMNPNQPEIQEIIRRFGL
jgi:tetratricopeptide (TPR) repeat protein